MVSGLQFSHLLACLLPLARSPDSRNKCEWGRGTWAACFLALLRLNRSCVGGQGFSSSTNSLSEDSSDATASRGALLLKIFLALSLLCTIPLHGATFIAELGAKFRLQ